MRHAAMLLVCALTVGSAAFGAEGYRDEHRRVRATQKRGQLILDQGRAQSPTFRRLVDRIERSDVIVYIDITPAMRETLGGSMRFVTTTPSDRYLHISLNANNTVDALVSMLGHELQHVVEVAEAPEVQSAGDLRRLYSRIGVRLGRDSYDSRAAQRAGEEVRTELRLGRDSGLRVASSHGDREPLPIGGSISFP